MSRFITQDIPGEALPQTHERRVRPPKAPKHGINWASMAWAGAMIAAGAVIYLWLMVWAA